MNRQTRLIAALVLAIAALGCLALSWSAFVDTFQAIQHPTGSAPPPAPLTLQVGSFAGLGALVLVLVEQWRRREVGWMAVAILGSYVGIIAYAVRGLVAHEEPA